MDIPTFIDLTEQISMTFPWLVIVLTTFTLIHLGLIVYERVKVKKK